MSSINLSAAAILAIAVTTHEVNRAWCERLGDLSQKPWSEAPEWQTHSAMLGVQFHLANPEAGDSASHDSWMAQKVADGWTYGEQKDEAKKTHPCMVPFDQLPADQQFKDRLFRTIVHAAAPHMPDDLSDDLAAVTAERDTLTAELDKAVGKYRVQQRRWTGKGRKTHALAIAAERADEHRADIAEAIEGEVELVFSDGKQEITGVDPIIVTGIGAWVKHPTGWMLKDRVQLGGPPAREGVFKVAGVGLYLDGRQLAWCQLHDAVTIPGGSTAELRDTIIF